MLISPQAERALIDLASRGLWLTVHETRLQVIATHQNAGTVSDSLRLQLARNRDELLEVVPGLEADILALTGPVVRVLFTRLAPDHQHRPAITRSEFSARYDDLTMPERVAYLWWLMDGPIEERNARLKGVAA